MHRITRYALALPLLACLTLIAACGGGADDAGLDGPLYRGYYVTDKFETSAFVPCGSHEVWWLQGDMQPVFERVPPQGWPDRWTAYVEVRGTITERGEYGHAEMYDREIRVDRVVHAQAEIPEGCRVRPEDRTPMRGTPRSF